MAADENPYPDAGSDDRDDSGQPQIIVDDPEDFAQTRQLRAIFDARDDYIEQRQEANRAHEQEGLDWTRMNRHIFRYLQDFAMAVEPLLMSHEKGKEIWTEREYSIEQNFVEKRHVASLEQAKEHMKQLADEYIQSATVAELQKLLYEFGLSMEDTKLERVAEQVQDELNPDGSTGSVQSLLDGQSLGTDQMSQQSTDSRQIGADVDTQSLGIQADRPASRVNLRRLQANIQQRATDPDPRQTQSKLSLLVVKAIFEHAGKYSRGMVARDPSKEKFYHRARVLATDWGWSVEGVQSLVGEVPMLAFSKNGKNEFGHTAPPQWLSNDVFRDLQQFIDDVGLGIQFDDEQQTKITDEVLNEVDSWRQKNVK